MVLDYLDNQAKKRRKKKNLDESPTLYIKIHSKCFIDLNVKAATVNLLEEKKEKMFVTQGQGTSLQT